MSRLRSRLISAEYWSDPDALRWPATKRLAYIGLWALAEDSGCLEDDPFAWRCSLFAGDPSVTEADLATIRDELITAGKLIEYSMIDERRYLYIRSFRRHQKARDTAARPTLPLPSWVSFTPHPSNASQGRYEVDEATVPTRSKTSLRESSDGRGLGTSAKGVQGDSVQGDSREGDAGEGGPGETQGRDQVPAPPARDSDSRDKEAKTSKATKNARNLAAKFPTLKLTAGPLQAIKDRGESWADIERVLSWMAGKSWVVAKDQETPLYLIANWPALKSSALELTAEHDVAAANR